jgi:hypothetical protein
VRELDFLPPAYKLARQRRRQLAARCWGLAAALGLCLILWLTR